MDALDRHITAEFAQRVEAAVHRYMNARGLAFKAAVFAVAAAWHAEAVRQGHAGRTAELLRTAVIRAGARHGLALLHMGVLTRAELEPTA